MKKNDDFEISEKTHFGPKKSGFGRIFKKIPGIDQKWPKVSKTSKKSKIGGKSDFLGPNHGFSQMAKTSQINENQRIRRFWRIFGKNKVGWSKNPKVPKRTPVVYIYVWESLGAKK